MRAPVRRRPTGEASARWPRSARCRSPAPPTVYARRSVERCARRQDVRETRPATAPVIPPRRRRRPSRECPRTSTRRSSSPWSGAYPPRTPSGCPTRSRARRWRRAGPALRRGSRDGCAGRERSRESCAAFTSWISRMSTSTTFSPRLCMSSTWRGVTSRMRAFASAMSCGYVFIVVAPYRSTDYGSLIRVEHGGRAERKRELIVDVTERRVGDARHAAAVGDLLQYALERWRLFGAGRVRRDFGEPSEDDSGALRQRAGQRELHEHAIDAIDRLVHVLEHEDRAVEIHRVGRPGKRRDERQISAGQPASCAAGAHGDRVVVSHDVRRLARRHRRAQRVARQLRELGPRRRTVVRDEIRPRADRRVQRGDVRVADQRLWLPPPHVVVDRVEQSHRAVAAANAPDRRRSSRPPPRRRNPPRRFASLPAKYPSRSSTCAPGTVPSRMARVFSMARSRSAAPRSGPEGATSATRAPAARSGGKRIARTYACTDELVNSRPVSSFDVFGRMWHRWCVTKVTRRAHPCPARTSMIGGRTMADRENDRSNLGDKDPSNPSNPSKSGSPGSSGGTSNPNPSGGSKPGGGMSGTPGSGSGGGGMGGSGSGGSQPSKNPSQQGTGGSTPKPGTGNPGTGNPSNR